MIVRIKNLDSLLKHLEVSDKRLKAYTGKTNTKIPIPIEQVRSMNIEDLKTLIRDKGLTIRKTRY